MSAALDLAGQRFGRLTAVSRQPSRAGHTHWLFVCDCGALKVANLHNVTSGRSQSCGCWSREKTARRNSTHGHTRDGRVTPTFGVWRAMRARCSNPATKSYQDYGGRGISVCERWTDFAAFLADMGEAKGGCEIDRIDNDGNYEPGNCRWVPRAENVLNRRNTIMVEIDGQRLPLAVVARQYGVLYGSLRARVRKGQDAKMAALSLPKLGRST